MTKERSGAFYRVLLLAAAIIWGSSFFIMKGAVTLLPVNFLLAIRFLLAAALLGIIFHRNIRACFTWEYAWRGLLLGALLYVAYFFQTYGLTDTTPGKNAFLTAGYVVLVPFMFWAIGHGRPDRYNLIAAITLVCGIGFITLEGDLSIRFGDWMTLLCAVFFAIQMALIPHFVEKRDPTVFTFWQFLAAGTICLIVSLAIETPPPASIWSPSLILSVGYLAVMVTAVAFLWQNIGQKHVPAAPAAVLLSLESVFGVLFSIIFYGEALTVKIAFGFALVFVAVIISETKLSFLRKGTADDEHQ